MQMMIILICLALFASCSSSKTVGGQDRMDMDRALKAATTSSGDFVKDLRELGPKIAEVMEAATSIGMARFAEFRNENEKKETTMVERDDMSSLTMVDDAIKALKTARASSGDSFKDLDELDVKLADLFKAAVPIGAIISKNLNPEPASEDYMALMKFKNQVDEIWNDI